MLLDTDVLIDIALDRRPHSGPSSELLDRVECGPRRAFVAWHTLSNFYYLVTSARGDADTRDFKELEVYLECGFTPHRSAPGRHPRQRPSPRDG